MRKTHLVPQVERMFIREGKDNGEISRALGIAPSTVSRWIKKYNMEERRIEVQGSLQHISERLLKLLANDVNSLDKIDNSAIDRITKAAKTIKTLEVQIDKLANTIFVMEQFGAFVNMKHASLFPKFQEILPDFLIYMREKYKDS